MKTEIENLGQFTPRDYQKCIFRAIENDGYKRVMAIWPRRSGKNLTAWDLCIRQLVSSVKTIYYVFPTFAMGRHSLWEATTKDGFRILDYLPAEAVESRDERLMRITLKNGSVFQIIGSDWKYEATIKKNPPQGVVFNELAISNEKVYKFISPILTENDGWALIVTGTCGKNFLYDMYKDALQNPDDWFVSKLTVDDTKHISLEAIKRELEMGDISEELHQQEYFTSFSKGEQSTKKES